MSKNDRLHARKKNYLFEIYLLSICSAVLYLVEIHDRKAFFHKNQTAVFFCPIYRREHNSKRLLTSSKCFEIFFDLISVLTFLQQAKLQTQKI